MAMKVHRWADIKAKGRAKMMPGQARASDEWVRHELFDLSLRELREMAGATQVETAEAADTTQAEISKTERREDHLLSKLRRYVEALGGELEVTARFGDRSIRLRGV